MTIFLTSLLSMKAITIHHGEFGLTVKSDSLFDFSSFAGSVNVQFDPQVRFRLAIRPKFG